MKRFLPGGKNKNKHFVSRHVINNGHLLYFKWTLIIYNILQQLLCIKYKV